MRSECRSRLNSSVVEMRDRARVSGVGLLIAAQCLIVAWDYLKTLQLPLF